jgi:hypothetical protein
MESHTAHAGVEVFLQSFHWKFLNCPPYIPNPAPSDYNLYGPLKQHFHGCRFHNNEKVETAVREWFQMQQPYFYSNEIFARVTRSDKCINVQLCICTYRVNFSTSPIFPNMIWTPTVVSSSFLRSVMNNMADALLGVGDISVTYF